MGGCLGTTAEFGPWANSFPCASVRGVPEMYMTQFLSSFVDGTVWLPHLCWMFEWPSRFTWMFEWPPSILFLWHNHSNLIICLSSVLKCLDFLLRKMKFTHSSMVFSSNFFLLIHTCIFLNLQHVDGVVCCTPPQVGDLCMSILASCLDVILNMQPLTFDINFFVFLFL